MADKASKEHYLEDLFCDKRLELSLLREITDNFSEAMEIGSGGYGTVYKGALQGGYVAVKKFKNVIDNKAFQDEVNYLRRIKHQNIVRYIGYCSESYQKFMMVSGKDDELADSPHMSICFEYLHNGSLENHLKTGQPCGLEWHMCYKIIRGICLGLHHLHEHKILHRDIKPDNILLDEDMAPKIADFGLSRLLVDRKSRMVTGKFGTPGYMAPECCDDGVFTVKSDIYSVGVVIRRMVTGGFTASVDENAVLEWSRRLNQLDASEKNTALDQVKACIEISVCCTLKEAASRPITRDILGRLITVGATDWPAAGGINTSIVPVQMRPGVETTTSATCKMLSARSLQIANNEPQYWSWISHQDSRFHECAELISVYFLAVTGEVPPKDLSAGKSYTVYLVYKLASSTSGLKGSVQTSSLRLYGHRVYPMGKVSLHPEAHGSADDVTYPVSRGGGWLELKLAEFANDDKMFKEKGVIVDLREEDVSVEKSGIIVEGMEFRRN